MKRLFITILIVSGLLCVKAQTGLFFDSERLSSSLISAICQDKTGYLWVGTDYGLNRFDGYRFTSYLNNRHDSTSLNYNVVVCLFCDNDGQMWIGTGKGLQRYEETTDRFISYVFPDGHRPRVNDIIQMKDGRIMVGTAGYGLYEVKTGTNELQQVYGYSPRNDSTYFSHIFEDSKGRFWKSGSVNDISVRLTNGRLKTYRHNFGTPTDFIEIDGRVTAVCRGNLVVFEGDKMITDFYDLSILQGHIALRCITTDRNGNIIVGTRGNGLFWIPRGTRTMKRYPITAPDFDLNTSKVWSLHEDRNGNMWVGCQQKGLFMVSNRKAQFSSWNFSTQKVDIGTGISSVCSGDNGMVWCTVQNNGIYGFDSNGHIVAHPKAPLGVEFIYRDSRKDYWVGTTYGVYSYNPLSGESQLVCDFDCDKYNDMTDDGRGHLFFSAFSKGMIMLDRATGSQRNFSMMMSDDPKCGKLANDWIMSMMCDREGRLWIGTSSGVCCYDVENDTFKPFGWKVLNDRIVCYSLCETNAGDIMIGTELGLYVWRRKTNKLEMFPGPETLQNLMISYIVSDNQDNLWCSTSAGIWHYNKERNEWMNFVNGTGLTSREYVNNAGMHVENDHIYFATNDGITTFTPRQVYEVTASPGTVHLTGLYLEGLPVSTLTESGGTRVTDKPITESDHFTISYLDNSFVMEFSLLNFSNTDNIIIEYRLNGSSEWISNSAGHNEVVFNHLASGTYKLEVRAVDNGVTSPVQLYTIVVTPPWYRTTLAYFIYLLLFMTVVVLGILYYRRYMRQQLDENKMKFLINATHDIRSPLTLIMSPLQKMRRRQLDEESQADLAVIWRNAQRILNLINQILDVHKIDKQQMHLHCRETEMEDFLKRIFEVYEYNAKERGINFTLTTPETADTPNVQPVMAWIDRTQFDKVMSNLLSNAFKYSFDHGDINITLREGHDENAKGWLHDYIEIVVTDTGTGLREDTIQHIFDRFYQAKTSKESHIEGTGIGLNLCKMIVDMHHGSITAANRTDGTKGSVFTVRVPKGCDHFAESEIDNRMEQPATVHIKQQKQPRSAYKVLVVDDDEEIGRYIGEELGAFYHFAVCHNGKDGLHELLTNHYDVVVSDVMMPEMDGFTMLRLIKQNANINHLPVIMLTSKSDISNRLEGLERGADAYLSKPFSMDELHFTIDNLISNHLRLKGKFSGSQMPTDKVEMPEMKGNDDQLMERIMKSVNEHLSDSDFSVDILCDEVGISRAHLHRKMKDMTGIPVSEFIRNIRLEQGARMLKEQKLNITQVAYAVGFSNLGYFSTVFRKHFGMSPREFIDKQN